MVTRHAPVNRLYIVMGRLGKGRLVGRLEDLVREVESDIKLLAIFTSNAKYLHIPFDPISYTHLPPDSLFTTPTALVLYAFYLQLCTSLASSPHITPPSLVVHHTFLLHHLPVIKLTTPGFTITFLSWPPTNLLTWSRASTWATTSSCGCSTNSLSPRNVARALPLTKTL